MIIPEEFRYKFTAEDQRMCEGVARQDPQERLETLKHWTRMWRVTMHVAPEVIAKFRWSAEAEGKPFNIEDCYTSTQLSIRSRYAQYIKCVQGIIGSRH
jgi:hypothetical protein